MFFFMYECSSHFKSNFIFILILFPNISAVLHNIIKLLVITKLFFHSLVLLILYHVIISLLYSNIFWCFSERGEPCLDGGRVCVGQVVSGGDSSMKTVPEETSKRSKEELRKMWRKAILQQILLQRMERENQKLQGELNEQQLRVFF